MVEKPSLALSVLFISFPTKLAQKATSFLALQVFQSRGADSDQTALTNECQLIRRRGESFELSKDQLKKVVAQVSSKQKQKYRSKKVRVNSLISEFACPMKLVTSPKVDKVPLCDQSRTKQTCKMLTVNGSVVTDASTIKGYFLMPSLKNIHYATICQE